MAVVTELLLQFVAAGIFAAQMLPGVCEYEWPPFTELFLGNEAKDLDFCPVYISERPVDVSSRDYRPKILFAVCRLPRSIEMRFYLGCNFPFMWRKPLRLEGPDSIELTLEFCYVRNSTLPP